MRRPRVNVAIAMMSLVVAMLLWLVQFGQSARPTETRTFAVPLSPNGLKKQALAVTMMPDTVNVVVTGSEARLARLRPDQFYALADLTKATPGSRSYPVQLFPSDLRDLSVSGTVTARVTIEPVRSRRVPVFIETKGELPDPMLRLDGVAPEPTSAVVTGPRSQVESVRRVRGFFDLAQAQENVGPSGAIELEAVDDRDRVLEAVVSEPLFARVRFAIGAASQRRTVLVVPKFIGAPAPSFEIASYAVAPTQIEVSGRAGVVAALDRVETEPVDLSGLAADREFEVAIRAPIGTRVNGRGRVKIRVRLRRLAPAAPPKADPLSPVQP